MSRYEFSLRQEVLMEKGAGVLGDLFRYQRSHGISDKKDPIKVLYGILWNAKQDILTADTEAELDEIETQFNLAGRLLSEIGAVNA